MSRFINAVILILTLVIPGVVQAQTCTPPVIIQVGGTNPVCAGQPVMLDAGSGWSTYQWSPGAATTRMISDTPSATMSYTVTTTDANGCTVTSQPLTVVVSSAPAAPAVQLREAALCAGGQGEATVSGTWSSYAWTVSNGTIVSGPGGPVSNAATVDYSASGSGPVGLTVTVTDANGCTATGSASVSVTAKPLVQIYPDSICAGSYGNASINPPAEGSWQSYHWTVTNGTIAQWSSDSSQYFSFYSGPSGQPVTVQVAATDSNGCSVISDPVTIPVRTIAKPTMQTYPEAICAGSYGNASINPPAEGSWVSYHWTVTNGTIPTWSSDSGQYLSFNSSPSGQPVIVQVTATDSYGCTATSDPVTIPVRTVAKPTMQTYPDSICAGSYGNASINPPAEGSWVSYHWTVTNGTIPQWSSDSGQYLSFNSSPSGQPVIVQATATDSYGCTATSDPVTIPVRTIAKPTIQTYPDAICPGSYGNASINPPAEGSWQSYHWTVTNGTIAEYSSDSSQYLSFYSSPSGQPVTVQVTATDGYGCTATSDPVTIPVRVLAPPPILVASPSVCPGGYIEAHIDSPEPPSSSWQSVSWSVTNAVTSDGGTTGTGNYLFARATGGPVTLTVTVADYTGCSATSTREIPVAANPPTAVINVPPSVCAGTVFGVTASDPNGVVQNFQFFASNATVNSIEAGGSATFTAGSAGPVDVYVTSMGPGATCDVYGHATTMSVNAPAAVITASGSTTFCAGGSVTLTAPAGMLSYDWSNGATAQSITVSTSGAYTVTVSNAPGCSTTSAPAVVTVSTPTTPTITAGPTTFCAGGSVTLTTSVGMSYAWSNGATSQAITVSASGSYSVSVTDAGGCSATSAAVTVTVNANPATPVITAGGPTTFCDTSSVALTAPVASSYLWSNGATTRTIFVNTSGSFSVTITDANGCSATSAPTTTTALPRPVPTVTIPTQFCAGTTAHASVAETFVTYQWSATSNGSIVGPANGQSVNFTSNAAGTCSLFLLVTNANGCQWGYNYYVSVQAAVVPTLSVSTPLCATGTGSANVNVTTGSTWDWSVTNATITATLNAQGQPDAHGSQIQFVATGVGITTVTVVEHAASGCSGTATQNVWAQALAPTDFTVNAVCPGSVGTASAINFYTSYSWSITNGSFIGSSLAHDVSFRMSSDPANPSVLTLTGSNGPGSCLTPVTHTVPVSTLAAPSIVLFPDSGICTGNHVTAYTASSGYDTYHWTISNGTIYSGASSYLISYSANAGGPATLSLTVTKNGCSSSSSRVIPVADTTPQPITAPDSICPTGTFTASAPAGYINYSWTYTNAQYLNGSGSGNAITLRPNGTGQPIQLSVSMQTTGFCNVAASSKTVSITATQVPEIAFDVPAGFCGGMTGNASVANGPYATYLWSVTGGVINGPNNGSAISFSADSSGSTTVAVTVTDGRGDCSSTGFVSAPFVNPKPQINATSYAICSGGSTTLSTQVLADSYLWSTGQTTPSITLTAVGDYTVTTTKNGCSFTSAPVHIALSTPSATLSANHTSHCPGDNSMLTVIVSGMTGFIRTYTWYATDQQTAILSGRDYYQLVANSPITRTFYCIVSDERGCSVRSNDLTINVYNPTAVITPSGPTTFCEGGSVTLTANAGSSYSWSNGATTQSITVTSPGTFNVYVVDTNGCGKTSTSTTVTVNPLQPTPTITPSGPTTFCASGSVTLTASAGSYYLWSTGATTQAITVNAAGSYSVTVTNWSGCSAASAPTSVTVNANPTATITAGGPTTFCAGGSVTLTASSGTSYLWSNGATTSSITVSSSGSYSVSVTNANGCSATSSPAVVTANANPTASITAGGPTTFCAGGSVTLTASSGAAYLWSTGATTRAITVNASGSYSVTETNAAGCSATSSPTTVTVNATPTASITAGGPTTFCAGGSVTLTASSGSSYLWSTGATTPSITASTSASYSVTVTNANGCSTASSPTVVTANANPTASITAGGPTMFCAGGSVTLTASSGASYLWSTGATTQATTVSSGGSYSVTVTNANGCSAVSSPTAVTVNANPTASITAGGPTTFCAGGSVTLTASSGTSYLWSTGAMTQSITASTSGNYSVTVTNTSGCSATSSPTVVTVNANPTASITAGGPTTFCAGGSVTLTASSGTAYLWSTGATTQAITASTSGNYSVTVTNTSGCSATSSPTAVTVNANPTASITAGGPTTFCAGGSVTLTASSGALYLWSTGATTQAIVASTSGNYSVTVTNANGCSAASSPAAVTVNANPTASITAGGPMTFCAGGSVTLTASSGASYLWSTGATTQAIVATTSASYSVTVTNANGCSATSSDTAVTVNANPTASITAGGPTTFCAGGSVTLTASSGTSYLWSNGATTQAITVNASGSYNVTVTANGCSTAGSPVGVTVNANPPAPVITAGGPTTFCTGGSVTLTAPASASYSWSNGAATQSIVASTSGNYTVTVTDANGCSATSTPTVVTVNTIPAPSIAVQGPLTFCQWLGPTTLTASPSTGTWFRNGVAVSTSPIISVLDFGAGSFVWRATNAGCTKDSDPVVVVVNPAPNNSAGGPGNICWNGTATWQSAETAPGTTYQWTVTNGTIVSGAGTRAITFTPAANATSVGLDWTVTSAAGCPTEPATNHFDIPVQRMATSISASGPTTFCAGGSVVLTAAAAAGAEVYIWSNGAFGQSIAVTSSGTYTVHAQNSGCIGPESAPVTVTVKTLPAATVSGGGAICAGGSATITAALTGTAPWSVTWSDNVTQPVTSGTTATRSVSPSSSTTYTVTSVSDASGCSIAGSGSAAVTVKTPTATVSGTSTICPGASATITAALTGTAPWSVKWSDNVTQSINSGTTATRTVNPSATTTYTVTSVTDASACPAVAGSGSATITRSVVGSITTQPANQSTTVNTNVTVSVVAAGTSPIFYQWFKNNGTIVTGATSNSYTTSFPAKGNYQFYVEVWNSCNTTHVKSHNVTVTVN